MNAINTDASQVWAGKLARFLPDWIRTQPALAAIADDLVVVMHGSTSAGVDDEWSDLDLWGFVSAGSLARADALSPTRFYEFKLDGKPGHLNLEVRQEAIGRVHACDMERIAELRNAVILRDCGGAAADMLELARRPMSQDVRRAWACYHYVEMRSDHRACDTPIERGDATALLLATAPLVGNALRCAMVLDGQPYPYIKWLGKAASLTPTGAKVYGKVQDLLAIVAADGLRCPGPEAKHPVSLKVREIRAILMEAARASGIDEGWLTHWWLWMTQAKAGIGDVRWVG
jgi:hypothetical protein